MKKSIGAQPLVYPTPVFVVGSYDKAGKPNVMTVSWGGICCSEPPCVAIALREATYTYHAIMARRAFTISIPSEDQVKIADYLGIASGRTENKFEKMKLTPVKADKVDAPYVQEFPLVLECSVKEIVKIGLHTQFIGEIKDIKVEEKFLTKEGLPDIEKIKPFIFAPALRKYYGLSTSLGKAFAVGKV
jgi:flavin reductase (DIM6/NTAB) family NADH-FMN oxidoreductase RutF